MNSIRIENDRSCALQVLEGHKPDGYRLSHFEQPAPLITSNLPPETSPHDSSSTQTSASSLWSGAISQCGSAFSRATSLAPSAKSHKRQQSASSLSYLQMKPLPPLPPEEPSPSSSPSPDTHNLQPPGSKIFLALSKAQHQKELLSADHHTSPLHSPTLSNFTASSASSYASHLLENPTDSFRKYIRIFHPRSQSDHITAATIDTGSDCCCIRGDVLQSLGIPLTSPLVRPTTLSSKGITGSIWQPLGRIELTWLPFGPDVEESKTHQTWFFIGDEGLPHPVLLGKDFLFPKEAPPRVFACLVNVLNRPSKAERKTQKETERRQKKLVRENEKMKEVRIALFQNSRSCSSSATCSSTSITAETS